MSQTWNGTKKETPERRTYTVDDIAQILGIGRTSAYILVKDLTQEQLAAQVGVRRETIMRLEKAQYNPSLKLAIDIARVVEAPIEEIFVFQ